MICVTFGLGKFTKRQREIFQKNVLDFGGSFCDPRPAAIFDSILPLDPQLTHIILDDRSVNRTKLCQVLSCPDIPEAVVLLHSSWLIDCTKKKKALDISPYLVSIDGTVAVQAKRTLESNSSPECTSEPLVEETPISKKGKVEKISPNELGSTSLQSFSALPLQSSSTATSICSTTSNSAGIPLFTSPVAYTSSLPSFPRLIDNELLSQILLNPPPSDGWYEHEGVLLRLHPDLPPPSTPLVPNSTPFRFVSFDMDSTLISTRSGKTHGKDEKDWQLWHPSVPESLATHASNGTYLAIISNQKGLNKKGLTSAQMKRKVESLMSTLKVPMDFICCYEESLYRKPSVGMWELLASIRCPDLLLHPSSAGTPSPLAPELHWSSPLLASHCMYVGDAAGRPKNGTRAADFSASDMKLSLNMGLQFQTPEVFFLSSTQPLHLTSLATLPPSEIQELLCNQVNILNILPVSPVLPSDFFSLPPSPSEKEIVIMVSPPACGKSSFARQFQSAGYSRVNQDALKTIQKCLKVAREALQSGSRGVIVDNTNLEPSTRKEWIKLAKEEGAKIRAVYLNVPKHVSFTLGTFRTLNPLTPPEDRRHVPSMITHSFYKKLVPPSMEEGFYRVDELPFSPIVPSDHRANRLFYMFLD